MKLVMTADGLRLAPDVAARHSAARAVLKTASRIVRACEAANFAACLADAERSRTDRSEPMNVDIDVMTEHDDSGRFFDSFAARIDSEEVSIQEHFASEYADELTGLFQAAFGGGLFGEQDFSFTVSKDSTEALIESGDPLAFLRAVSAGDTRAQEILCAVLEEAAFGHGLSTGDSAARGEQFQCEVTKGQSGAATRAGRQSDLGDVVYLTNALGEPTGYGTVEVTDDLLHRVPFENGPGFVLPYLVEVDGRPMVLGNLEISYTCGDGLEIRPGRHDVALSQANEITERLKQRAVHRSEVKLLATEDDGRHVVVRVLVSLQDTASATRTLLQDVFDVDAEGWIDVGAWV